MKLLLDEMWSPVIAARLSDAGHDVVAVAATAGLRSRPDEAIFAAAQQGGRAIVTENVVDFRPLAHAALARGSDHAGMVFTSNRSFPRADARTGDRLVAALHALLEENPDLQNAEHWLSPV